jgi:hypothetical protein
MELIKGFFQDRDGGGSMSRAVMFGTFLVSSIIMLWLTHDGKMSEGYFTMYLSIPTLAYAHSKYQDDKVAIATTAITGDATKPTTGA